MLFEEAKNNGCPSIIFLHGGGLSAWSLTPLVNAFKNDFHVVTPIIDGHGADGAELFVSISDSAAKLIDYIDANHGGKVFALAGLSIGAQIVTEVLSQRADIAQYAIIESALVYPLKAVSKLTIPLFQLSYGFIRKRWFSKLQANSLNLPENLFETYYRDSLKMSKQSLINMTLSNGSYSLKKEIANTKAKVLILVGEKEIPIMLKSAQKLKETIPTSELYIAPAMKHGQLSLQYPLQYAALLEKLFKPS